MRTVAVIDFSSFEGYAGPNVTFSTRGAGFERPNGADYAGTALSELTFQPTHPPKICQPAHPSDRKSRCERGENALRGHSLVIRSR